MSTPAAFDTKLLVPAASAGSQPSGPRSPWSPDRQVPRSIAPPIVELAEMEGGRTAIYSIRIMKLRSIKREQCCGSCRLYRLLLLLLIVNYGGFRMGTSVKCRLCFRVGTMVKCWACVLGKGSVRSVGTKRGETRWNSHVMRRTGVSSPDSGNGGTWFNPGHA